MRAVKRTCVEFLVLGVIGVALGFGANAVRARGSIKPTKNYFAMSVPTVKSVAARLPERVQPQDARIDEGGAQLAVADTKAAEPAAPAAGTNGYDAAARRDEDTAARAKAQVPDAHPKHDFQTIGFEDVVAVFNDPDTRGGLNVFVDARNDDLFAGGRIPGAVQCDPYEQERYLPDVLLRTSGAERVIVYCGGGDCQDSIFMCRDLIMQGVPFDSVYLFEGGWKEWEANDMPIEKNE